MADQPQSAARDSLSSSNELTLPDSRLSNLSTAPATDLTASITSETVQGIDASVVADHDGSSTKPPSMQPTSCAEVTSSSLHPCGPATSPKTGTTGADSADCESVLSPVSPTASEQQPRLLTSQPISLASVPPSIPKSAHALTPAD
ncbi:hypothetical protein DFH28DRAFT_870595, partial [Melampsora americana]